MQVKPKPLYCTAGKNCWCFNIEGNVGLPGYDKCLSPKEILEVNATTLTSKDIVYLNSLKEREFIY